MDLFGATVLVTGANGTVGRAVVEHLGREGARVRAMARRPYSTAPAQVNVVRANLGDVESLAAAVDGADLVVHCAAILNFDIDECMRVNVEGTANLLRAMERGGCRGLVHVSTSSVYDPRAGLDFDEDSPTWSKPVHPYGYTKAEAERLIAASVFGARSAVLRPVMVLAMTEGSFWGPLALQRAAESSPSDLVGRAEFHYVHVDNLAHAVVLAARGPLNGRAYNVMDGVGATADYVAAVCKVLGCEVPEQSSELPEVTLRAQRIRDELGYAPTDRWREFLSQLARAPRPQ